MVRIDGFEEFADELEEFANELEEMADEIEEAVDRGTRKTALEVEREAKEEAPVDTGELRADIAVTQLDTAVYSVGSTKEYAPSVEYGSAPHPITPDDAEVLHFTTPDGEEVFTTHVDHPGTPAQPFLRPALNRHRENLIRNIKKEIRKVINSSR